MSNRKFVSMPVYYLILRAAQFWFKILCPVQFMFTVNITYMEKGLLHGRAFKKLAG
jgi:hypothetical protein